MKKLFWLLLIIPTLCWSATGDLESIGGKVDTAISTIAGKAGTGIATICGKNYTDGDAASCTTANDSALYSFQGDYDGTLSGPWEASRFTTTVAFTLTEYQINICDNGSDAGNVIISVYTNDAENAEPESEVAGTEVSVNMSAFPNCTTYTATNVALAIPKVLDASTIYWIVVEEQNGAAMYWERMANEGGARKASVDGLTWPSAAADKSGQVIIMGCE